MTVREILIEHLEKWLGSDGNPISHYELNLIRKPAISRLVSSIRAIFVFAVQL
jgi:hypothetical protein